MLKKTHKGLQVAIEVEDMNDDLFELTSYIAWHGTLLGLLISWLL